MRKGWKVKKDSEVTDLPVKLVRDLCDVAQRSDMEIATENWGDDCIYMNGWWEVCERVRKRATTRDANLDWPWVTVRSFLSFLTQPFPSFSSPYFPLNLSLLHLVLPFSICPTSFASLQLPEVPLVVILLSVMRKGHGTHGNLGFSVTILSLADGKGAKTRRCVYLCIHGCVSVWARVHKT